MKTYGIGFLLALGLLIGGLACPRPGHSADTVSSTADLEVFVREGCPRCATAEHFLTDLQRKWPALQIIVHDIGAVYTRILTLRQLPWWAYYGYLGLYNVAYMFDDGVMLILAVVTLGRRKLQEKEGRWLKLLSGVIMLGLGVALIAQ